MRVEVFSSPIKRTYSAPRCSAAYLLTTIFRILSLTLPFLLSYKQGYIWKEIDYYHEQPDIRFKYKVILVLRTLSVGDYRGPDEIFYSTYPDINALRSDSLRVPKIRVREIDVDIDGILLFFDFKILKKIRYQMESVAYLNHKSAFPISSLYFNGELELIQKSPFSFEKNSGAEQDFRLNLSKASLHAKESNINEILLKISKQLYHNELKPSSRDAMLNYKDFYTTSVNTYEKENKFNLTIDLNISPNQIIYYQPSFTDVIHRAWIQYISLAIIINFFLRYIRNFSLRVASNKDSLDGY